MTRKWALCLLIVAVWVGTYDAQITNPCTPVPAGTVFTVTSGRPFTITWLMAAQVPASPTDPTMVTQRINGFYLQIDTQPRLDVNPPPGAACPTGTTNAGKIPYLYPTTTGVTRGSHTMTVRGWNYVLDASGNPTTTRQEGVIVSIPFVADDLTHLGAPSAPTNGIVRR